MPKHSIHATASTPADAATVWDVVADVSRWSDWGPWDATYREQDGAPDPDGLGAIRVLEIGRYISRERVTSFRPASRLDYELLSGLPLRNYRARIVLLAQPDGGTAIDWSSRFDARYPGTGRALARRLGKFLAEVTESLAEEATRRSEERAQPAPVACSLNADDRSARLEQMRTLGRDALVDVDLGPGRARLRFAAREDVRARVEEIVEAEARCCAFLSMQVRDEADAAVLEISSPEGAEPVLDELVGAFTGATEQSPPPASGR